MRPPAPGGAGLPMVSSLIFMQRNARNVAHGVE